MGQYFVIANLDKQQFLNPTFFGDGPKLVEFGCSTFGTVHTLALLVVEPSHLLDHSISYLGAWAGQRLVTAGDYAAPNRFVWGTDQILFEQAKANWENISWACLSDLSGVAADQLAGGWKNYAFQDLVNAEVIARHFDPESGIGRLTAGVGPFLIVNLDKEEILRPEPFFHADDFGESLKIETSCLTGLIVLSSDGNGYGTTGDLESIRPIIGSWAGDRIVIAHQQGAQDAYLPESGNLYSIADRRFRDVSEPTVLALLDDLHTEEVLRVRQFNQVGDAGCVGHRSLTAKTHKKPS